MLVCFEVPGVSWWSGGGSLAALWDADRGSISKSLVKGNLTLSVSLRLVLPVKSAPPPVPVLCGPVRGHWEKLTSCLFKHHGILAIPRGLVFKLGFGEGKLDLKFFEKVSENYNS